jgi:alginate O-acetyltransferase complex protein AlgI
MLFNSLPFLIFFPIVLVLYFIAPYKYRWVLLLIASCYFYMYWKPEYIILLTIPTFINYMAGLTMGKTENPSRRKTYLILSLVSSLSVLFIFKYLHFVSESLSGLLELFHIGYHLPFLNLLLPIGISFYTFKTMGYAIDVYRGAIKPEKHFGFFALYVTFFPQLLAGPIERAAHLIPQFYKNYDFEGRRVIDGLKLMAWGFFKKVVIADKVSIVVDQVYNHPTEYTGLPLIVATLLFTFQIYCDFSGYSDIAMGAAQVMGFNLMDNFNRPYSSKSVSEFWRRWHISLSTWFRDYVYISLGGNRVVSWRWYYNLFITFLLSGLWHGASWTFLIWGALHGFYILFSLWTQSARKKIVQWIHLDRFPTFHTSLRVLITFLLISFAWIFFRAKSISDVFYIVTHLFTGLGNVAHLKVSAKSLFNLGLDKYDFYIALISIGLMELVHMIERKGDMRHLFSGKPVLLRWALYYILILFIIFFGAYKDQAFIYFQF